MITFAKEKEASKQIVQAMKSGNETEIQKAWQNFHASIAEQVMADFEAVQASNDTTVLAQRGYRQLTAKETKFYQNLIGALKSSAPEQAFATILTNDDLDGFMPETILTDVYKNLADTHPLLNKINFQYVGYTTKWILNDHTVQTAVWGSITDSITKEITSAFKVVSVDQSKLSAYAVIERGMLDLGPVFMDGYVRRVLQEALANGLEQGIVSGDGDNKPIGLTRDIHKGVSVSLGVYPEKSTNYGKYTVTSFSPTEYGKLVAALAKTENGRQRTITDLTLLCTPNDYYTKIMPATTLLNANGAYVNNLFPVPTDVIQTTQLTDGQAVLFLPSEYSLFAGGRRGSVLEYSDDFKFLEDCRTFKIKQYATGRAFDNTSSLLLDISGLKPAFITVQQVEGSTVNAQVSGTVTTSAEQSLNEVPEV